MWPLFQLCLSQLLDWTTRPMCKYFNDWIVNWFKVITWCLKWSDSGSSTWIWDHWSPIRTARCEVLLRILFKCFWARDRPNLLTTRKIFFIYALFGVHKWRAFFKKWAIPCIFFFIFVFSIQLTVNIQYNIFADEWIQTADLWIWKRPLYQLSHHHCPNDRLLSSTIRSKSC